MKASTDSFVHAVKNAVKLTTKWVDVAKKMTSLVTDGVKAKRRVWGHP